MIVQRVVGAISAGAVLVMAALVVVVSVVFAIYTLLCHVVSPAAASALIVAAIAAVLAVGGLVFLNKTKSPAQPASRAHEPPKREDARAHVFELARQKPLLAAGAATAAGIIAWRNPRLVHSLTRLIQPQGERS